jgi:hypothetical protein
MDWQQTITLLLAAVAGGYLARNAWRSVKSFRAGKGGCGSGCGKCAFAPPEREGSGARVVKPGNVISLADVRPVSKRSGR